MSCSLSNPVCGGPISVLSKLLASTYVLMLKTQNVHWNVKGCGFFSVHSFTESHYEDLFDAIDEIAERIRKIGGDAPATFTEYLQMSVVSEKLVSSSCSDMTKELLEDHRKIVDFLKTDIKGISGACDYVTDDLLVSRFSYHEKVIWMLSSASC